MEIKQNAPNNLPALDGLAGGTRDLGGTEGTAAVSSLPRASGFAYWISFLYSFNFNTPVIAPRFSFVNTASALDITNANATNVPYVFPVNGANGSRADKYIAQEPFNFVGSLGSTSNVNHTDFYARTCNWLFNEMETQPDNISCSNINECYATDIAIQQNICNGIKSYKVTNVPATSIVSWTAVPSTGYQLITSGNSATIYCNQNLSIALTANYTDYCGTAQTITRNFVFSLPTATLNTTIIDNTTSNWCTGIAHTLTILAQNQLEVYNWIVPSPLFTVLSSSGNTAQILYNGGGNANTNIQCNITSYCYKPATVNFTVPLLKMGDNITKTIQAELVDQSTLQTVNNIADNNATVQILVPSNPTNVAVYSLLNGQPEAFGYFGNGSGLNTNVMSIYNRSGGSYNISASVLNGCNTQVIIPFTINLTNARYNYPFIFTIAPNPVLSTTTVTVNLQNISNSVLQSCLLGGGNIRVEVFNFNTGLLVNTINAPALATSVAVNMNGYPAGMYTFRITGLNCAGFYQEVQQVIKQ